MEYGTIPDIPDIVGDITLGPFDVQKIAFQLGCTATGTFQTTTVQLQIALDPDDPDFVDEGPPIAAPGGVLPIPACALIQFVAAATTVAPVIKMSVGGLSSTVDPSKARR